jgi:hypothetical protein
VLLGLLEGAPVSDDEGLGVGVGVVLSVDGGVVLGAAVLVEVLRLPTGGPLATLPAAGTAVLCAGWSPLETREARRSSVPVAVEEPVTPEAYVRVTTSPGRRLRPTGSTAVTVPEGPSDAGSAWRCTERPSAASCIATSSTGRPM